MPLIFQLIYHKILQFILLKRYYWKLNNYLLKYKKVKQQINELIPIYWERVESERAYGHNWELLKYELGKFFRKFGSDVAKQNRLMEDEVLSQLSALSFKEPLTDSQNTEYSKL